MQKEFVYTTHDAGVKSVHLGVFPAIGRYFIKKMEYSGPGVFRAEVDLPMGKSFFHFFENENFISPMPAFSQASEGQDALNRTPVLLKSKFFCPLEFGRHPRFINYLGDGNWELKAITHHSWIERLYWVSPEESRPFRLCYTHKNKKYWRLRFRSEGAVTFLLRFEGGDRPARYQHLSGARRADPDFSDAFSADAKKAGQPADPGLNAGYQIYPDAFHRSPGYRLSGNLQPWGSPPAHYTFFGGNLLGIEEKLPYLADLGIDFIYLNPIFYAKDAHRYNCSDYRLVDPVCGTNQQFGNLVGKAHEMGIKVILDISVNHCGTELPQFRDILEKQEESRYCDWFFIRKFPVSVEDIHNYQSWNGYKEMPLFNLDNPEVRSFLLDTIRYWMENYQVDGWRLDVCTEAPPDLLREITETVRSLAPDGLILGECWYNLNAAQALEKGQLSGITNFSLYWDALIPFFADRSISVAELADRFMEIYWLLPTLQASDSWNFLGNHDTPRFNSLLGNKDQFLPALALSFILPGTPVIYYGDELGMEGLHDPENRACMDWPKVPGKSEMIGEIRNWIRLRKSFPAVFRIGALSVFHTGETAGTLGVARKLGKVMLLFYFNFGRNRVALPIPEETLNGLTDPFTGQPHTGRACFLPPFTAKALLYQTMS